MGGHVFGTGRFFQPVPKDVFSIATCTDTGLWRDPVPMSAPIARGRASPGAIDVSTIWYWLIALPGAFVSALAPVCAVARLASARRRPRVPAIVSVPVGAVAGTFDLDLKLILFSSSGLSSLLLQPWLF